MGLAAYDPDEKEIERFVIEIQDYNERVTNLQYLPSPEEIRYMVAHLPVEVSGDPTERIEVSNYKDQPRIETNQIRGGVCLVTAEGLTQKAPKLWKRLAEWGREFGLSWDFLEQFLALKAKVHAAHAPVKSEETKLQPNNTFIADAVAGRPVLALPMAVGGFRLRYGRGRVSGFSAASVHPATMAVLDQFIAIGTQLKVERPGKGAALTTNDSIEGPIVRMTDGSVLRLSDFHHAKKMAKDVEQILFLGDILFNYGDFSENGHKLVPAGYCPEWWVQEFERAVIDRFGTIDYEKIGDFLSCTPAEAERLLRDPYHTFPPAALAALMARRLGVPLHPEYTFFWKLIDHYQLFYLYNWLATAKIVEKDGRLVKIIMKRDQRGKSILEAIGLEHIIVNNEFIVIGGDTAYGLLFTLGLLPETTAQSNAIVASYVRRLTAKEELPPVLTILSELSGVKLRDKAGTFIGARMGRPEKAKMRKLAGSPQALFPVGDEGGRMRAFQAAMDVGKVDGEFAVFYCDTCAHERLFSRCEICDNPTKPMYYSKRLGKLSEEPDEESARYKRMDVDVKELVTTVSRRIGVPLPPLVKGVRGTSNKDHIPEHPAKGILRAKWDIYVNKDGTTRYDLTELPMTHFKPKEVGTSVARLRELGYLDDCHGMPLERDDQILELKPQDIVIPSNEDLVDESAANVLLRVAGFIDELLERFYGLAPFHNFKRKEDLIGTPLIGLAPHISAGMIGRIVGFSQSQAIFAHPLWHAALRRDCDGDEACLLLLMDGFLNFSRQYLPDRRGSRTMDSPLVLTTVINPREVDDMALGLDIVDHYPVEFYEAALEYRNPWDVSVEQIKDRLSTPGQYEGMGFTIDTASINQGVLVSSYKTLPSMREKLAGQMELAKRIRAVDETIVADLVIQKHFLKDIMGNLRKFSQQQFRCVKCNKKFRRPPLAGKCTCGGKILFTISEGSIVKYLEPSIELAEVFSVSPYIKQSLELLKLRVESVFGKEKERQAGLGDWA